MNLVFIGILLGICSAILGGVDTIINKSLMKGVSAIEHSLYRIFFVTPVLFIAALLNWKLSSSSVFFLTLYGVIEALNILFHQMAVKVLNPVHVEIFSKSKTLTTYVLSVILVIESVSVKGILGVLLFSVGLILTVNFKADGNDILSRSSGGLHNNKGLGYLYELISVLARTIKPFVLIRLIADGGISNEVLAFISMIIAFIIILIVFRPRLNIRKIEYKKYIIQAIIVGISMITAGYAVIYAGAVIASMTENLSIFVVGILMFLLWKEKASKRVWAGAIFAIAGMMLVM